MNGNNLFNDLTAGLFTQSSGLKNNSYGSYLFADRTEYKKISARNTTGKDFRDILSSTIEQGNNVTQRQIRNVFSKTADRIQEGIKKPDNGSNVINEAKAEVEEKGRQVIKKAAQILGIEAEELTSMLASMNISLSDMGGSFTAETLINQIDAIAGLDMGQKKLLAGILLSARESLYDNAAAGNSEIAEISAEKPYINVSNEMKSIKEEAENKTEVMTEKTAAAADNAEGHSRSLGWNKMANTVLTVGDKSPEITELAAKLQDIAKANETEGNLFNKKNVNAELNEVPESSEGKTENLLTAEQAVPAKDFGTKSSKVQDSNIGSSDTKTDEKPDPASAQTLQNNGHGGTDGSSQEALNWDRKVEVFKVDVSSKTEDLKADDLFQGILSTKTAAETIKAERTDILQKSIPVKKEEVLSQIVEKAKIVFDAGKSEMVMELKPESLGKLSLKIIHERGMILAKFTAESEQVKQVLETNMQLLKDVLQKQGLSVQGLDVSVGQDASARQQAFESGSRRKSDRIQTEPISNTLMRTEQFTGSETSRYNWSQSSINLTA